MDPRVSANLGLATGAVGLTVGELRTGSEAGEFNQQPPMKYK
jgi:hypothetical protein